MFISCFKNERTIIVKPLFLIIAVANHCVAQVRNDIVALLQEIILPKLKDGKLKYGLF